MPVPRSLKLRVAQADGEIRISSAGAVATYAVTDHVIAVKADDPNLRHLKDLEVEDLPTAGEAGPTTTPEPPAEPQEA